MEQSFQEFRQIAGIKKGTKHKVTNSFGIYDIYKLVRKNGWYNIGNPVTEHDFYAVVRLVNSRIAEGIANGEEFNFPFNMGGLELRKTQRGARLKNGKLKVTYPVDWNETLKLWYKDEEARKSKIILRYFFGSGIKLNL